MTHQLPDDLFTTNSGLVPRLEMLGGKVPVILVDGVYKDPARLREAALELDYRPPNYPYPGRIADIQPGNPSLETFLRNLLNLVNRQYLARVPRIADSNGQTISAFARVLSDFGIIDTPPEQLAPHQRRPHVDPVPIFGLIYLNEEERGGTMFFEPAGPVDEERLPGGYFREGDEGFSLIGRIGGQFNRLAVYPGFVPHSGDIAGEWIASEERVTKPRLTQRFLLFP